MAAAPTPASPDVSSGNSSILSVRVVPSQDKAPEAGSAGAESHLPEQSSRVPRRRFACVLGAAALVVSTTIGLVTAAIAEAEVAASVDEAFEAQVDVSQAALDAALSAALHDTTMLVSTGTRGARLALLHSRCRAEETPSPVHPHGAVPRTRSSLRQSTELRHADSARICRSPGPLSFSREI